MNTKKTMLSLLLTAAALMALPGAQAASLEAPDELAAGCLSDYQARLLEPKRTATDYVLDTYGSEVVPATVVSNTVGLPFALLDPTTDYVACISSANTDGQSDAEMAFASCMSDYQARWKEPVGTTYDYAIETYTTSVVPATVVSNTVALPFAILDPTTDYIACISSAQV
jgi:hypothetical protein